MLSTSYSTEANAMLAPVDVSRQTYPFTLPELPYGYDALAPHIDRATLELHHQQHHATYVKKLNAALAKQPRLHHTPLAQLLREADQLPDELGTAVKHNGGGHLNHDFFWRVLAPTPARAPRGAIAAALTTQFGSFADFRKQFSEAASGHFASGWVALALDPASAKLEIADLADHEVLETRGRIGLIIIDVWEHAYYLKYQNRRPEFVAAFWNIVNWGHAEQAFARAGAAR